jgi:hypothetical protein
VDVARFVDAIEDPNPVTNFRHRGERRVLVIVTVISFTTAVALSILLVGTPVTLFAFFYNM